MEMTGAGSATANRSGRNCANGLSLDDTGTGCYFAENYTMLRPGDRMDVASLHV